ncbi:MAG: hypothetical protein EBT75_05380, partial [Proteobacteria bacterium]|nr:hypothetical protein [Pseudomonadota bacterium]
HWLRTCVLSGGDDYELVFTAPVACRPAVLQAAHGCGTPVTCIGSVSAGSGIFNGTSRSRSHHQPQRWT